MSEEIAVRILKLGHSLNGLGVELGEELFEDFAYGERRVPHGSPFVITGFTFGERSDLSLFYRIVRLIKPTAPTVSSSDTLPQDLAAAVLELERSFAGLKLELDRSDHWIDYTRPFRGTAHRVPVGGPNILTGLNYGHLNNDIAMFYGTLVIKRVPDATVMPGGGSLDTRVTALEAAFERLQVSLIGAESSVGWSSTNSGGGNDGARITDGGVMTAISWGNRVASSRIGLVR